MDILLVLNEDKLQEEIALDLLMRTTVSLEKTIKNLRDFYTQTALQEF